jgi:hypothetical protein
MTNAEKFKQLFGIYATELRAMPEEKFLEWLNAEALEKQEWHNAKTDPPKKPDNMWDTYYVYTNSDRYGIARYYAHGKWDGYDEDGDWIEEHEIIAYCNFKPYTER